MKKVLSFISVILIISALALTLAGCGKTLKGTYTRVEGKESLTFEDESTVKGEIFGLTLGREYSVNDDKIKFEYLTPLGIWVPVEYSFSKQGKSIFIDGKEFVKQ